MPHPNKPAILSDPIRLNLYLAKFAGVSRRQADKLISQKKVYVNKIPATLGQKIIPGQDQVSLGSKLIIFQPPQYKYLILNKPAGYITTTCDQFGRPSVVDLIPSSPRLYPVGRLDWSTTGLLLFTNDGQLALCLTHPRYHLPKTYEVITTASPTPIQFNKLTTGIDLEDGRTQPAKIRLLSPSSNGFKWRITIFEGRNRQIRRMCQNLGLKLLSLSRVSVGPLNLGTLPPGSYRYLTLSEIKQLKKVVQ